MPPFNLQSGTVLAATQTRCGDCGAPIMAVRVQTDSGLYWGAVELWCGSYRAHQCPQTEAEGVAA